MNRSRSVIVLFWETENIDEAIGSFLRSGVASAAMKCYILYQETYLLQSKNLARNNLCLIVFDDALYKRNRKHKVADPEAKCACGRRVVSSANAYSLLSLLAVNIF